MGTLAEERYSVCLNHPERQEIFKLETLLIEASYPYYFNFWEDLRPVFGGSEDGDPESIDWDTYNFMIEVCVPREDTSMIRVNLCKEQNLLELLVMTSKGEPAAFVKGLTAAAAMENIKIYF